MPKQKGPIVLQGTIGKLTYYKMEGKNLVRSKSSLNKERVSTDPAFKRSRAASAKFGKAAKIASQVYKDLPPELKLHGMIGKLTGAATRLLKEGHSVKQVKLMLLKS